MKVKGLTPLDFFAAQAMQALIAKTPVMKKEADEDVPEIVMQIAGGAYLYAKAMMQFKEMLND